MSEVQIKIGESGNGDFIIEENGERIIRMIYDSHTRKHGEHTELPMPPDVEYWLYRIDDEQERKRYLHWYGLFARLAS